MRQKERSGPLLPILAWAFLGGVFWVLLVLIMAQAEAQTATVTKTITIDAPTKNEDGSPLAASAIKGYQLNCGGTAGGPYDALSVRVPGSHQRAFAPGRWFCTARTIIGEGATEQVSIRSNEAAFTVDPPLATVPRPGAPSLSVN